MAVNQKRAGTAADNAGAGHTAQILKPLFVQGLDRRGAHVVDAVDLLQVLALGFDREMEIGPELGFISALFMVLRSVKWTPLSGQCSKVEGSVNQEGKRCPEPVKAMRRV